MRERATKEQHAAVMCAGEIDGPEGAARTVVGREATPVAGRTDERDSRQGWVAWRLLHSEGDFKRYQWSADAW